MRTAAVLFAAAAIVLASCRAGAREGLGPTGVPLGSARAPESAMGPATDAGMAAPSIPTAPQPTTAAPVAATVWKAEYYKISDG